MNFGSKNNLMGIKNSGAERDFGRIFFITRSGK